MRGFSMGELFSIKHILNVGLSGWIGVLIGFVITFLFWLFRKFQNRKSVQRKFIYKQLQPLWQQNNEIFLDKPSKSDPDYYDLSSESKGQIWRSRVNQIMIPNHDKIISICKKNYTLMTASEVADFKEYEDHVASFKSYHEQKTQTWKYFPNQITNIFKD